MVEYTMLSEGLEVVQLPGGFANMIDEAETLTYLRLRGLRPVSSVEKAAEAFFSQRLAGCGFASAPRGEG